MLALQWKIFRLCMLVLQLKHVNLNPTLKLVGEALTMAHLGIQGLDVHYVHHGSAVIMYKSCLPPVTSPYVRYVQLGGYLLYPKGKNQMWNICYARLQAILLF